MDDHKLREFALGKVENCFGTDFSIYDSKKVSRTPNTDFQLTSRIVRSSAKKFEFENNVLLDPIYTAKLFFAIDSMIERGEFKDGSTIIAIHTGGLQGRAGMKNKVDKLLS